MAVQQLGIQNKLNMFKSDHWYSYINYDHKETHDKRWSWLCPDQFDCFHYETPSGFYNSKILFLLKFCIVSQDLFLWILLKNIFASQGLRSALLNFTLGIVRRIFVIPAHCHLLDFDSYAPCNDVIFSQSTRGFHFLSFECPENWLEIIIGSVSSYKLFVRIV